MPIQAALPRSVGGRYHYREQGRDGEMKREDGVVCALCREAELETDSSSRSKRTHIVIAQ